MAKDKIFCFILAYAIYHTGGAQDYINRNTNPTASDQARKAICILPNTLVLPSSGSYTASIDPNTAAGSPIVGLQAIDYAYHIRGGLLGINLDGSKNPIPNSTEGDLFSYKLDYETAGQWDGNIGKETWKTTKNTGTNRSYTYQYDPSKRILAAIYTGGQFANENYGLENISYDKNGNIKTFTRRGMTAQNATAFGLIDILEYQFSGNRLNGIRDYASNSLDVGDFRDNGTISDYTYWNDGSLKSDANRGINSITWESYLNKIKQISYTDGRWIKYFYDGSGKKLRMTDSDNTVWDYNGSHIYKTEGGGQPYLYQINDDEGRIVYSAPNGGSGALYTYEFNYTDHLGNSRVGFKADGQNLTTTQENAYYPFGMGHTGTDFSLGNGTNFLYNGKEKINSFGLNYSDYGFRHVDLTTNRFISSDPLAHKFPFLTNYQYASNSPIMNIDLDGLEGVKAQDVSKNSSLLNAGGASYIGMVFSEKKKIFGIGLGIHLNAGSVKLSKGINESLQIEGSAGIGFEIGGLGFEYEGSENLLSTKGQREFTDKLVLSIPFFETEKSTKTVTNASMSKIISNETIETTSILKSETRSGAGLVLKIEGKIELPRQQKYSTTSPQDFLKPKQTKDNTSIISPTINNKN